MQNHENQIQTPFGVYHGLSSVSYYPNGKVKDIRLNEKNMLVTHVGELVPYYGTDTPRRKYKSSITFYENGMVRAVSLEEQQEIETPIGEFPAELVAFYDTGELKRFFPLDGQISGFWSEEEERALNIPFRFEFDFATFSAILVGICFYKSGNIRSITLFPGEVIRITTPLYGVVPVKSGFSLYESGTLHTVEPAMPILIKTPIGDITAYDVNAIGINADSNSLEFDEQGRVIGIVTSTDKVIVKQKSGAVRFLAPIEKPSPLDEEDISFIPLQLRFHYDTKTVTITEEIESNFCWTDDTFHIYPSEMAHCTPQDCASCSLCSH